MQEINFIKTSLTNYKKRIPTQNDANNIYFITDTNELIIGNMKFGSAFITVDNIHQLPNVGRSGYLYLDKSGNEFCIKVWDELNGVYTNLPLATTSYLKSISRGKNAIIGTSGDGRIDTAELDSALTNEDIASLFHNQ